jgi:cyclomaltodextrin glucanotransferase
MVDFRGETIYFIVVDRFHDGDPSNSHGKEADFDPTRRDYFKYWGGDLRGILEKLDYIQSLGATAIWITPVFDQVDTLLEATMAPYHGYWAKDFKRLDEHLVDHPDEVRVFAGHDTIFDKLVAAMHQRGMKLILDIVCNHSNPHVGGHRGALYDDGKLIASHDHDSGGWYRHEGGVEDWNDLAQVQTRDLCGLADFNEDSHAYRTYIKDAIRGWLDKGVDALRVDTVKHMPLWFWQEFTGDMVVHKPDVWMFGEWFQGGCWDPSSIDFANKSGMTILDFGFRNAVVSALANRAERGFREVAETVEKDALFSDASELVTFIDNHDLPRFLSISNDPERFRIAQLLTLVSRGIPCLYYGDEQGLHDDRNGGNDPYNRPMMTSFERTPIMIEMAELSALRRRNPAARKAGMRTKFLDADRWVFTRPYQGNALLVGVNRSDAPSVVTVEGLELRDGEHEDLLGGGVISVAGGRAEIRLPARGIVIFEQQALENGTKASGVHVDVSVHGVSAAWGEELYVCGDAPELGGWDPERAVRLDYINAATWATTVAFTESAGRDIHYKFIVKRGSTIRREPGLGHRRRVPTSAARWMDDWRL